MRRKTVKQLFMGLLACCLPKYDVLQDTDAVFVRKSEGNKYVKQCSTSLLKAVFQKDCVSMGLNKRKEKKRKMKDTTN